MDYSLSHQQHASSQIRTLSQGKQHGRLISSLSRGAGALLLGLTAITGAGVAQAATADSAPAELTEFLSQVDAAANQQDVGAVMQFYSPELVHSDGLHYEQLESVLTQTWGQFTELTYQTELTSWEATDNGFTIETTTTINGTQELNGRNLALTSTISSRQEIEDQKIVEQRILTEQTRLTSGENPPTVTVNLPAEVGIGREFSFDAIVAEPLGNRQLLGAAVEEPINVSTYLNPNSPSMEMLSAGGLFKVGRAPVLPEDRWISAIIVHEDGITAVTQRLHVVSRQSR